MQVYLDTNIFWKDFDLTGSRIQPLVRNAQQLGFNVVVSEVVVGELVAQYRESVEAEWQAMRSAARSLHKLLPDVDRPEAAATMDLDQTTTRYRLRLLARLNTLGIRVARLPDVSHEALLARDLSRRLPFRRIGDGKDQKGTVGYRDTLIWETIVAAVTADASDEFVLVTENKQDFARGANALHPSLIQDLSERGLPQNAVRLYTSVQDFIDENVTERLEAAEQIRTAVNAGEIHLADWLKGSPLRLGGAEAFDLAQFGITGFQVMAVEQVEEIRDLEINAARRLGDGYYLEGVASFDLRLIIAVDVGAFASAAGLETPISDVEGRLSGADSATVLADFSATISEARVPQSVSLTRVWLLDPGSSLGELQPHALAGQGTSIDELRRLHSLNERGLLTSRLRKYLDELVGRMDYGTLAKAELSPALYVDRILRDLESRNWPTQNPALAGLRSMGRDGCAQLQPLVQELLGRNVLQAADGGAYRAQGFMRELLAFQQPWPRAFVEGLLLEGLVNESGQFRCKHAQLPEAIAISAKHPEAPSVFERASREIRASTPKSHPLLAVEDYQRARAVIEQVQSAVGAAERPLVQQLGTAVDEAEVDARVTGRVRSEPI